MPSLITYDQWKNAMLTDLPDDTRIDCIECDGSGYVDTDTDLDGDEAEGEEEECSDCEGHGSRLFGDMADFERRIALTRRSYLKAAYKDLEALANFHCRPISKVLLDYGIDSYSCVKTRKLVISNDSRHFIRIKVSA